VSKIAQNDRVQLQADAASREAVILREVVESSSIGYAVTAIGDMYFAE